MGTNFFCIMGEDNKPLLHDPAPYQPQQGGYPPAPQQGGYPPAPQQGGYPPAPQQGGYPPQQGGYGTYQQGGGAPGVPTIFPENPIRMTCNFCNNSIVTRTNPKSG